MHYIIVVIFRLGFPQIAQMASIITGATRAAHSAVATVLSAAQIPVGEAIPSKPVKEDDPVKPVTLDLAGKNIIVRRNVIWARPYIFAS